MDKILLSIILAVLLSLIGVAGDFFLKISGQTTEKFMIIRYFVIGMLIYALTAFGWFFVLKNIKLASVGVIYSLSSILFLILLGVAYFKESLNYYEIIGIILALISIILMSKFA